jgi:hypothetical protein
MPARGEILLVLRFNLGDPLEQGIKDGVKHHDPVPFRHFPPRADHKAGPRRRICACAVVCSKGSLVG